MKVHELVTELKKHDQNQEVEIMSAINADEIKQMDDKTKTFIRIMEVQDILQMERLKDNEGNMLDTPVPHLNISTISKSYFEREDQEQVRAGATDKRLN